MAKYVYSGVFVPFTTARAGDVSAEFQAVQSVSATEEKRVDDAIKFPASESTDIRITETPAQRIDKVLAFDGAGDLAVKSVGDAGVIVTAGDLPIVDAGGHYTATDVEAALGEILTGAQTFTGPKTFANNLLVDKATPQFNIQCADEATEDTAIIFRDELSNARAVVYRPSGTDKLRIDVRSAAGVLQAALDITEAGDVDVAVGTFKATGAELTSPVINTGVSGTAGVSRMVQETALSLNGVGSRTFSGIPSWVKKITIGVFDASAITGLVDMAVQIGDSVGIETTGYRSNSNVAPNSTTYHIIGGGSGGFVSDIADATCVITNTDGNTWNFMSVCNSQDATPANYQATFSSGRKTLTAVLTQLTVSSTGNNFDAGTINITYEG